MRYDGGGFDRTEPLCNYSRNNDTSIQAESRIPTAIEILGDLCQPAISLTLKNT